MEFLRQQGVPFQEVDVSRHPQAGQEILRRPGQPTSLTVRRAGERQTLILPA